MKSLVLDPVTVALPASSTARSKPFSRHGRHLYIGASWTGTAVGTLSLQRSLDGGVSWRDVPRASPEFTSNGNNQPAGSAGSADWSFLNVPPGLLAILYTASSGTGTLTLQCGWND